VLEFRNLLIGRNALPSGQQHSQQGLGIYKRSVRWHRRPYVLSQRGQLVRAQRRPSLLRQW